MAVRVANIDIARHLPHALSVASERRAAAEAALRALEARRVQGHNGKSAGIGGPDATSCVAAAGVPPRLQACLAVPVRRERVKVLARVYQTR